ncbi:lipoprotein BA_5634 family protein [Listeria rocourtiae]|uniref:lipoprotein BA_5634 family protein n=1 Tax=Listeria rocourtiae TaxID=647910 RepID=UPI003D2F8D1D
MKKFLLIGMVLGGLLLVLSGCIFDKAKGLILYGSKDQVTNTIASNKKDIDSSTIFAAKQDGEDDNLTIFLKETDAKSMQKQQAFTKVVNSDKTEVLKELPATKGKMILLAKDNATEISIGAKKQALTYGGNITLGDARTYAKNIVIVPDNLWESVDAKPESVATVMTKKDAADYLTNFQDVDKAQLADLKS